MSESKRLHVVDALRGFAIVSIMLLHNVEHFDFYYHAENLPHWMPAVDKVIWDTLFFLFGGKSYAIFALLFGLTFFIQSDNQEKKGKDFRGRFAWRLLLLMGFGLFNSLFYEGDILSIYAMLGFALIPVARLNTKTVFWIATLLMMQPVEWIKFMSGLMDPAKEMANPASWAYFGKAGEYITGDSLWATLWGNITNGKTAVVLWTWEAGRVLQTISLFMFGMLVGRQQLFVNGPAQRKFWQKALLISGLAFIPLFIVKTNIPDWISSVSINRPLELIITSWSNMAFMMVLVAGFTLLFHSRSLNKVLSVFSAYGRMSLSNYVMQSMLGAIIYYGFGLGLYQFTGATYCLLIGLVLAVIQGIFSKLWMSRHPQGPLETIWHKLTWL